MINSKLLSYKTLKESEDWTVDFLILMEELQDDKRVPLNELVEINQKSLKKYGLNEKENKYITVSSLDKELNMVDQENIYIKEKEDLPKRATLIAEKNDILMSKIRPGTSGIALITDNERYVVSNAIIVLTPKKNSLSRLLYFLLSNEKVVNEISSLTRGTTNNLPLKLLKKYKLPLKSLPLEKVDQADTLYDKYYNSFENEKDLREIADEIFKKELLLKDISTSEKENKFLVADYNKYLLNDTFSVEDIFYEETKEKWDCREVKINNLVKFRKVRDKPGQNEYFKKKIPRVTISEMLVNNIYVDEEEIEFVKCEEGIDNEYLEKRNVIMPKMAASTKKASVVGEKLNGAIVNQNVYVIETQEELVPEYLVLFLKTKWGQKQLDIMASGSTIRTINRKNIKNISLPLPDKKAQQKIVEKIKEEKDKNSLENYQNKIAKFQKTLV